MRRYYSLKDIERERYRLYLEKELVNHKLKYFYRNTRNSYRLENIIKDNVGSYIAKFVTRFIWRNSNLEPSRQEQKLEE
ncbi:hypothetical protein ACT3CE_00775 [Marinifilum sp. RC60d5]|uniref:hypothetical protein n=1 Tax=Marinifilum sp. RC60d5 TaxID=3458414 RepID=UPI0040368B7D